MGTSVGIRTTESTRPYNIRAAILPEADPCEQFHTGGMAGLHQFASPRYPNQYPPNIDCVRVIHAPPGYGVRLKFRSRFQDVRDGRYSFSPRVARLCGMRPPTFDIMSESGVMWLHFHSDNLLQYRGFFAEYEFVRKNSSDVLPPPDCHFSDAMPLDGYVDTSAAQRFYQVHRNSSSELDCVWQIQVPKWLQVAVFIEEFELAKQNQCYENVLEIYAGHIAEQPMRRYCGVTATHTYTGQSTVFVRVFFAGPLQVQNTRIRVLFSTYAAYKNCSEHELFSCGDDVCIPHSLACNGRANCLYRRDETHCMESTATKVLMLVVNSSYSPLFIVTAIISITVVCLCVWYRPFRRKPNEGSDDYLRELTSGASSGITPLAAGRTLSARHNPAYYTNALNSAAMMNSVLTERQPSGSTSPSLSASWTLSDTPRRRNGPTGNGSCVPGRQLSVFSTQVWNQRNNRSVSPQVVEVIVDEEEPEAETSFMSFAV